MIFRNVLAACCFLLFFQFPLYAQRAQWGQLLISLPEGWSSNMKSGNTILSNYNIKDSEPFSVTLFKPEISAASKDSLFYMAWAKYLANEPAGPVAPRPRRMYTEIGIPFYMGSKEVPDKNNPSFYLLGVYELTGTWQAILLHTTSAKAYRELQSEWQDRMLGIMMPAPKK